MYIRKVTRQGKTNKNYTYYRLVENIRTEKGPRQHTLLNLGRLTLPAEKHPLLAQRISEYLNHQIPLFQSDAEVESLAFYFAHQILNQAASCRAGVPALEVMLDTLEASEARTIGAEQVGVSWFRYLELDRLLGEQGLTDREVNLAALSIIGRLIEPGSERGTLAWARERSALGEVLGEDFGSLSKNNLYEMADCLYSYKEVLERHLWQRERTIFNLREHLILYDLTNTYLEGSGAGNGKAHFGNSKERRHDCRLITLGLVVDEDGFPKTSRLFSGRQSEPETLREMVLSLAQDRQYPDRPITVIVDAGVASEENVEMLKEARIGYVVVSRRRYDPPEEGSGYITLRDNERERIRLRVVEESDEKVLYVHSLRKELKETSMRRRFESAFEEQLNRVKEGLSRPNTTKRYDKVLERIGRLKERYRRISSYYQIEVVRHEQRAVDVSFRVSRPQELAQRYSGSYFLRTNRLEWDEVEIWNTYNLIRRIEKSFQCLKSDLGFRPIYHQKEGRCDAHLFISVLAYHLLVSLEHRLRALGDHRSWSTIRKQLSTHIRVTVALRDKNNRCHQVRLNVKANPDQKRIYKDLLVKETMIDPQVTGG